MANNIMEKNASNGFQNQSSNELPANNNHHHSPRKDGLGTDYNFKRKIVWKNVIAFFILHMAALYGLFLILTFKIKFLTYIWVVLLIVLTGEGITMGAHRLYSHKSYKATFSLRLFLILCQTMAGQNCMYIWVRDHRLHHKFSDTDADPHNATRGFFFSHMGWLMSRKHPLIKEKGKTIDMSDLEADELVMIQKKYYKTLYINLALLMPLMVATLGWGENFWYAASTVFAFRYTLTLHLTWFVNSLAHLWGTKPFDRYILPSENGFVAFLTGGEGWHNYHHTFPWDYRTSELGSRFNLTESFINFFERLGLAYDLKAPSFEIIEKRLLRTGDGSHPLHKAKKDRTYRWGEEEQEMNENHIE